MVARVAGVERGAWYESGMGYWSYYLFWIAAWFLIGHPLLLLGVVVFVALRPFIPDPYVWLRTAGKIRTLRAQIDANPANSTARRDLARIYLARRRPKRALELLDQARERHPDDSELLFLTGQARFRAGDAEGALEPLIEAVAIDPRTGFGEPYRVAGDALTKLKRLRDAEDAYEHLVDANSSSIEGWFKLARVRLQLGDDESSREAKRELLSTWRTLPSYLRRKEWWWRARSMLL